MHIPYIVVGSEKSPTPAYAEFLILFLAADVVCTIRYLSGGASRKYGIKSQERLPPKEWNLSDIGVGTG